MAIYQAKQIIDRPPYMGGGQWTVDGLADVTVLMGKNGSGKSVLLRAWRDQKQDAVHYVVPERTGDIEFQAQYIQEEFDGAARRGASVGNFVQQYRRRIMSRIHTYFMIRGNTRGAASLPTSPEELEFLLSSLIPDFSIQLLVRTPPYELKRIGTGEVIRQIDQLSSGEAQLLTISLDILTIAAIWEVEKRAERIVLVDEPDAHIHPDLQTRFSDFLLQIVDRFSLQLLIATHSTSLMSALGQLGGRKTSVIYMDRSQSAYRARSFDKVTSELASCLGGHVLMGPLFGAPLLLVEGDDDFRIWSQVPRHHVIKLAVLPCNGDEIYGYQQTLERILASLCDKRPSVMGFALLDGDKAKPSSSAANPQQFIGYLVLNCREAENLYLTDVVLNEIGHTWPSAQEAIKSESGRFGAKKATLASCSSWNRRKTDIKTVINEIATILDRKNVPWTVRVGTAIGRSRPGGELADFLGPAVVESLWGKV